MSTGRIPNDDRDAYPNKRVDLPGFLLANLFRTHFATMLVKDIKTYLAKEIHGGSWKATGNFEEILNISNIHKVIKSTNLEVPAHLPLLLEFAIRRAQGSWTYVAARRV